MHGSVRVNGNNVVPGKASFVYSARCYPQDAFIIQNRYVAARRGRHSIGVNPLHDHDDLIPGMEQAELGIVILLIHFLRIVPCRGIICTLKYPDRLVHIACACLLFLLLPGCRTPTPVVPDVPVSEIPPSIAAEQPPDLPLPVNGEGVDEDVQQLVHEQLSRMSRRQRIAQRFVTFVPRSFDLTPRTELRYGSDTAAFVRMIAADSPAGFIVYPWNYRDRDGLIELTAALQRMADILHPGLSFFVSADQEGGRVAAFRFPDIVRTPSAASVARHGSDLYIERLAFVVGVELNAMGVNMNLAPVLDLVDTPDASIIGDRAWGNDPDTVARFAAAYTRGIGEAGVIATAKHFPGHGVTRVDSHGRLPVVEYRMADLVSRELIPFVSAIEAGIPTIMTAHILFPHIDSEFPVTMSPRFVNELLREQLGFDGVVISDGLEMGALRGEFDLDTTLAQTIRAGVDLILLYDRYNLTDVIDRVERLIDGGHISMNEVDRSVERILLLKARYGLLR